MRKLLLLLSFYAASYAFSASAEIQTVPRVDVQRYLTDWYQIAHIPLWFEGDQDCACARQRLGPTDKPGTISVLNTCTKTDGSLYSIAGTAVSEDPNSNAKFVVRFDGVAFDGSYWVIGLDKDYRYAVVTDKWGYSLYILSSTPKMSSALYKEAVAIAQKQLDTSKLQLSKQENCKYPR